MFLNRGTGTVSGYVCVCVGDEGSGGEDCVNCQKPGRNRSFELLCLFLQTHFAMERENMLNPLSKQSFISRYVTAS